MSEARLACLGGAAAPAELTGSFSRLRALPERAQAGIWDVLDHVVVLRDADAAGQRVEAFARLHEVEVEVVDEATQALAFLLQAAAARNLAVQAFTQDVAALLGEPVPLAEALCAGYPKAKERIRRDIQRRTLLDHGKVLTGLDWRIDVTRTSHRGMELDARVAVLTLHVQDAERGGLRRETLHATPDVVAELRRACDVVLGALAQADGGGAPPSA